MPTELPWALTNLLPVSLPSKMSDQTNVITNVLPLSMFCSWSWYSFLWNLNSDQNSSWNMPPVSLDHLLKLAMTFPCPNYVQPELQNMTSFVNSVFTEVKVEHLKMTSFWIYENDLWCPYEGMEREICTHEEGGHMKMDSEFGLCFLPSQGPPEASRVWERPGGFSSRDVRGRASSWHLISDFHLLELPFSRENTFLLFEVTQLWLLLEASPRKLI